MLCVLKFSNLDIKKFRFEHINDKNVIWNSQKCLMSSLQKCLEIVSNSYKDLLECKYLTYLLRCGKNKQIL